MTQESSNVKLSLYHNVKWKASLSDGTTYYEGKAPFECKENEKSPWQRLLDYLHDNPSIRITSLSLYTDDGRTFNLPSAGKRPKFGEFEYLEKPIGFRCFRKYGQDVEGNSEASHFTVIEAQYPNYNLQLWVDENNIDNCWCLVKTGIGLV